MKKLALASSVVTSLASAAFSGDLTAIDVLVLPGPEMLQQAATWNAVMRAQTPEGFTLDPEHAPHVTLVQLFVATADLGKVLGAVAAVKATQDVGALTLTATGLYHIPSGKVGLAGIVVKPTPDLLGLQQAVIEAVRSFARSGGDQSAFVPDASGAAFDPFLFNYVEGFVSKSAGKAYNPHVTVGIAPLAWLETLEAEPFEPFDFSALGIAVYQLGNSGTASRRLDLAQ